MQEITGHKAYCLLASRPWKLATAGDWAIGAETTVVHALFNFSLSKLLIYERSIFLKRFGVDDGALWWGFQG